MYFYVFSLILNKYSPVKKLCCRSFDCCSWIAASSDEWRDKAGFWPVNTQLSFAFGLSWRTIKDVSQTRFVGISFFKFPIFSFCFLVTLYLQRVIPRWQTYKLRCNASACALEDWETLPLLPQPLYGGLMIYCSGFSSDLEGGQFNKRACILPRPSDSSHSQRNVLWCHCVQHSCDPVQRLSRQNSLSGERRNPAWKPNPMGTAHSAHRSKTLRPAPLPSSARAATLMLTAGRQKNVRKSDFISQRCNDDDVSRVI